MIKPSVKKVTKHKAPSSLWEPYVNELCKQVRVCVCAWAAVWRALYSACTVLCTTLCMILCVTDTAHHLNTLSHLSSLSPQQSSRVTACIMSKAGDVWAHRGSTPAFCLTSLKEGPHALGSIVKLGSAAYVVREVGMDMQGTHYAHHLHPLYTPFMHTLYAHPLHTLYAHPLHTLYTPSVHSLSTLRL